MVSCPHEQEIYGGCSASMYPHKYYYSSSFEGLFFVGSAIGVLLTRSGGL